MKDNTKILLGVAAGGIAAYYLYSKDARPYYGPERMIGPMGKSRPYYGPERFIGPMEKSRPLLKYSDTPVLDRYNNLVYLESVGQRLSYGEILFVDKVKLYIDEYQLQNPFTRIDNGTLEIYLRRRLLPKTGIVDTLANLWDRLWTPSSGGNITTTPL